LVSGRPISFKMDLYNPLYVPRPTVEPELFASLRPPTYSGGFKSREEALTKADPKEPAGEAEGGRGKAKKEAAEQKLMEKAADTAALRPGLRPNDGDARFARETGKELSDRLSTGAVGSAATAGKLGDSFQYVIDHPVTLARQKSAMLPIVGKDVEGQRVSIYNPGVQAKHPLLGLRFKNTSGLHLNQGPITVFEGSTYAGDTRVLDVQPNEERH